MCTLVGVLVIVPYGTYLTALLLTKLINKYRYKKALRKIMLDLWK